MITINYTNTFLTDAIQTLENEEFRIGWGTLDEIFANYLSGPDDDAILTDLIHRFEMSEIEAHRLLNYLNENFKQYQE
jgi:hypothetical protein